MEEIVLHQLVSLIFDDFGWKKTWMSPLVFPWNKPQIARGLLGARSTSSTACGAKTLWVLDQRDAIAQIAHEESLFRSPHVMLHQGPERCRVVFTIPNWGFFLGILWSPGNGMFLICLMTLKHSWSMEPGECQWDGLGFRVYHIRTVPPSLKLKSSSRFLFCRPCLEKFGPLQSLLREEI